MRLSRNQPSISVKSTDVIAANTVIPGNTTLPWPKPSMAVDILAMIAMTIESIKLDIAGK